MATKCLSPAFSLCLALALAVSVCQPATSGAEKGRDITRAQPMAFQRVDFDSLDTKGFFFREPVRIRGYLRTARTGRKNPGAVLAPACNGLLEPNGTRIRPNYVRMARILQHLGITVLLVDGFTPRGFEEICTQPGKMRTIDTEARIKDSLGGLEYLRSRGDVMPDRIFLVTWGAAGGLQSINKASPYYEEAGAGFAAAVMFYPRCENVDRQFSPYAPIQMYVGEEDTWNPPEPCLDLAKRREPGSASFEVKIYPKAYHGFDHLRPPSLRTDAVVGPVMIGGTPSPGRMLTRERRHSCRASLMPEPRRA